MASGGLLTATRSALASLRERESALQSELDAVSADIDASEKGAHAVLRVDPPIRDEALVWAPLPTLQRRAEARAAEWRAAIGGGRVVRSAAWTPPPSGLRASAGCEPRLDGWLVEVETPARNLSVAAACASALPPDGRATRLLDATWLEAAGGAAAAAAADAAAEDASAAAGLARTLHGAFLDLENGGAYDAAATRRALAMLAVPAPAFAHLCRQPLIQRELMGTAACAELSNVLKALGDECCAWCLPMAASADGIVGALGRLRMQPPAELHGKLEGMAAWWARLDLYLAAAACGLLQAGQEKWLARAQESVSGGNGGATSVVALLRQIVGHPKSDAGRRLGAGWLLQHLQAAPAPAGALVADALATQLASADGRMRLNRKPF